MVNAFTSGSIPAHLLTMDDPHWHAPSGPVAFWNDAKSDVWTLLKFK